MSLEETSEVKEDPIPVLYYMKYLTAMIAVFLMDQQNQPNEQK